MYYPLLTGIISQRIDVNGTHHYESCVQNLRVEEKKWQNAFHIVKYTLLDYKKWWIGNVNRRHELIMNKDHKVSGVWLCLLKEVKKQSIKSLFQSSGPWRCEHIKRIASCSNALVLHFVFIICQLIFFSHSFPVLPLLHDPVLFQQFWWQLDWQIKNPTYFYSWNHATSSHSLEMF